MVGNTAYIHKVSTQFFWQDALMQSNQNTQPCPLTSLTLVLSYVSICCELKMINARTMNAQQDN